MNLFRNYEKEFEDLQKSISTIGDMVSFQETNVRSDITKLNKNQNEFERELIALYEKQDEIFEQLKEIKALLQPPIAEVPVEDIKVEPVVVSSDPIEEVYFRDKKITNTFKKDFKFDTLDTKTFSFRYASKRNQTVYSKFTMFDVLLLLGVENETTWESWTDLVNHVGMGANTLKPLLYNIKKGFFDKFDFESGVSFSKNYGLLYVNGKKTNVTVKTARYIVDCITNSPNPMTTLLKLAKGNECSNLMYKMIGTNYKNPQLTSLLYDEVHVPIENNPQKRKEMGM
jgi:hypothetical protein